MDSIYIKPKKNKNATLKLVISAVILFAASLGFSPEAGIIRTVPLFLAGGIVSGILGQSIGMMTAFSGVFTACIYFVRASSVSQTVVFAVLAMLLTFEGIYAVKLVTILKNTQNKSVKAKCVFMITVGIAVAALLSLVMCGNLFSFYVNSSANQKYIRNNYSDEVEVEFTSYSPLQREYRTYVTFTDEGNIIGADNECYVSGSRENLNDGIRNYYEEKMLTNANKMLSDRIVNITSAFEITESDVVFENDEILRKDSSFEDYAQRIGYVVSFYSIIEKQQDFLSLVGDVKTSLDENGVQYKEIIFFAGNASKVLFGAKITPQTDFETIKAQYSKNYIDSLPDEFNNDFFGAVANYGVTEERILDYWNNK